MYLIFNISKLICTLHFYQKRNQSLFHFCLFLLSTSKPRGSLKFHHACVMSLKILNLELTHLSPIFKLLCPSSFFWPKITQLKIDHNPFAKGFRDNYDT